MKIAVIGHKRIPSTEGGIEKVVREHVIRMAAKGHTVHIYNRMGHNIYGEEYDVKNLKEYMGAKIITIPTIQGAAEVPIYSFLATLRAVFGRYDVIAYHASGSCVMIGLAKLFGCRCVAFLHGIDSQRDKWGRFASFYLELGEKTAAIKADACMVLSKNAVNYILERYGKRPLLFANGIDRPEKYEANIIKNKFGLEKDGYILSLGRIVPEKGLHYLIEAYKNVKTDKKLVIAGGVTSKSYYGELVKMAEGDERIIFTGFVQGQELGELYSNAYIYCMPSNLEGMANTLLEGMAYGNCCLLSDIEENSEVAKDRAMYFNKGNAEDLAKKLRLLVNNREMVEYYRQGAAEYVLSRYNWDKAVDGILNVFDGIYADYNTGK